MHLSTPSPCIVSRTFPSASTYTITPAATNVTFSLRHHQGVLLSLSGGGGGPHSYRKNIATGEEGRLTFNSLSPGEYYLRPTMKEYRFEPSSRMIRVEEGKSVLVRLVGRRVAFSAYGTVSCLNGEPEAGLLVEARGQAECADLQEEATTREDGTWRIRGLEPKVSAQMLAVGTGY